MSENRTVTMLFDGISVDITRPTDTKYEEYLNSAFKSLKIPIELQEFFVVLSGDKYLYGKEAFDRYVKLYPDCDFVFELRMNFLKMKERLTEEDGKFVIKPVNTEKRKSIVLQPNLEDLQIGDEFDNNGPNVKRFKSS